MEETLTDEEVLRVGFDADYYRSRYPDIAHAGLDPLRHFADHGWREGRDPARWFSISRYLDAHADVAASGMNPFIHYLRWGRAEGRVLDLGLGFRYDLVRESAGLETRLQRMRRTILRPIARDAKVLAGHLDACSPGRGHLTVSHDDYIANVGGIQLCLRLESAAVRAGGGHHINLIPGIETPFVDVERHQVPIGVMLNGENLGYFQPDDIARLLGPWLKQRSSTIAVHSLIGHSVEDVIMILRGAGPSGCLYWVHDYSSACASFNLLRDDTEFCGAPAADSNACQICVYGRRRRIQRSAHLKFLDAFDVTVICPSESARDVWRQGMPYFKGASRVLPHTRLEPAGPLQAPHGRVDQPLRVAFLGMPTPHKGWPAFAELAEHFAHDRRYEFLHLGHTSGQGPDIRRVAVTPSTDDPTPMPAVIRREEIDVALIWSPWPETFCFAAHEAWAGGAAVVTRPEAGAAAAFVRDSGAGRVLENYETLMAAFETGEILALSRARRDVQPYRLIYSRMSLDVLTEAWPCA